MKNALIFIGLLALSVLYLLEVDFSNICVLNWIAFAIIAATLIPFLINTIVGIKKKSDEKAAKKALKIQQKQK